MELQIRGVSKTYANGVPASLSSDGVRNHPGMPFGFPPERAFSFAGIPTEPEETDHLYLDGPLGSLTAEYHVGVRAFEISPSSQTPPAERVA